MSKKKMSKKQKILLALVITVSLSVLFYFIYYFVAYKGRAGSGSVTLTSQADWQAGTYDTRLDLTSSPGNIVLNLLNPSWLQATGAANWSARHSLSTVVYDNKMWAMGGYNTADGYKNDVWWSTDGITWTQATASANWPVRAGFGLLVYDNKMWVIGGAIYYRLEK